jgi:hypothetical protein
MAEDRKDFMDPMDEYRAMKEQGSLRQMSEEDAQKIRDEAQFKRDYEIYRMHALDPMSEDEYRLMKERAKAQATEAREYKTRVEDHYGEMMRGPVMHTIKTEREWQGAITLGVWVGAIGIWWIAVSLGTG